MDSELAPKLHEAVAGHCADGDALAEAGRHHDAIVVYNKAWALLPDPKKSLECGNVDFGRYW